jgi:hypothetical protein
LKHLDVDNYKKLGRVIKYLRATIDLPLRLGADPSGNVQWWVDASYATHTNMRGHTGGTMSLGYGSIYSTSNKQKLVTRSSTESELVGVHDVMPQILWTKQFLDSQQFPVKHTIVYQDNTSSILLEKHGRASSSQRTKHMNVRYFFVHDRVNAGDITIQHCPTTEMLADYFTKPLQGTLFRRMRDNIMNIVPGSKYYSGQRSVLEIELNTSKNDNDASICIGDDYIYTNED